MSKRGAIEKTLRASPELISVGRIYYPPEKDSSQNEAAFALAPRNSVRSAAAVRDLAYDFVERAAERGAKYMQRGIKKYEGSEPTFNVSYISYEGDEGKTLVLFYPSIAVASAARRVDERLEATFFLTVVSEKIVKELQPGFVFDQNQI